MCVHCAAATVIAVGADDVAPEAEAPGPGGARPVVVAVAHAAEPVEPEPTTLAAAAAEAATVAAVAAAVVVESAVAAAAAAAADLGGAEPVAAPPAQASQQQQQQHEAAAPEARARQTPDGMPIVQLQVGSCPLRGGSTVWRCVSPPPR